MQTSCSSHWASWPSLSIFCCSYDNGETKCLMALGVSVLNKNQQKCSYIFAKEWALTSETHVKVRIIVTNFFSSNIFLFFFQQETPLACSKWRDAQNSVTYCSSLTFKNIFLRNVWFNFISRNKKVLLHERKRHTDCGVSSITRGGVSPPPSGYPPPDEVWWGVPEVGYLPSGYPQPGPIGGGGQRPDTKEYHRNGGIL